MIDKPWLNSAITNCDEAGLYLRPKKLGKLLNRLEEQGFDGYLVYGEGEEPKMFRKD